MGGPSVFEFSQLMLRPQRMQRHVPSVHDLPRAAEDDKQKDYCLEVSL